MGHFNVLGQFVHPKDAQEERKFDFWIGQWDVNLKVKQGDGSWKGEHQAVATIYPILGSKAILELWDESEDGILGYSLRYYNNEKKYWDLWLNWPTSNQSSMSSLEGNFKEGRGDFFSEYVDSNGVKRISRYSFYDITENSLQWQDGYSRDEGKTWDSNWIMEFNRTAQSGPPLTSKSKANTYYKGNRCNPIEFDALNKIAGKYVSKKNLQSAEVIKVLDGCMIIGFLEDDSKKFFFTLTYDNSSEAYEFTFLDEEIGTSLIQLYGQLVGNLMVFNAKVGNDNASILMNKNKLQMAVTYLGKDYNFQLVRK